ncbi:MAG TPA: hypothetical protein PLO61_09945 [Fimbriimonadaceae bacterium]|nr:hypothetical protein [Fimbriimonadaceae bacterium]HRJ33923.1 hypothetical protein [Fimbriimonadaceae bacterium]
MKQLPIMLVLSLGVLPIAAQAQTANSRDSVSLKAGFFVGQKFESRTPGTRVSLEGFDVGLDIPFMRYGESGQIRFSPSVMFGGTNRKGGDTDGTLYRMLITAQIKPADANLYGTFGAGYAWSDPRGGANFDERKGFCGVVGMGWNFGKSLRSQPFVELNFYFGNEQFTGGGVSVGIRF